MKDSFENREALRIDHTSPLQVKNVKTDEIYEARLLNFSTSGIYFESNGFFQKGAKIYICIQNSPYFDTSGVVEYYNGEVMWRKELENSPFDYGYGIQLITDSSNEDLVFNHTKETKESRKHPRKPFFRSVHFSTPQGKSRGRTKNISPAGVFIATEEKLEVGQSIKLSIPLKGKPTDVTGTIVWLNGEGFGLKFHKAK